MRRSVFMIMIWGILYSSGISQSYPNQSPLTIEEIMKGEDFTGYSPENIRWSSDSKNIYFSWNPEFKTVRKTYRKGIKDPEPVAVHPDEQVKIAEGGDFNIDRTKIVFGRNGDIFLKTIADNSLIEITQTLDEETNPVFAGNDEYVVYEKNKNLFAWHISMGTTLQLTNFKEGKPPEEEGRSAGQAFLERDQLRYFKVLAERKKRADITKEKQAATLPQRPATFYLEGRGISNLKISPDLRYATFLLITPGDDQTTSVPDFVTYSGYTEDFKARAKVGQADTRCEFMIYNIEKDSICLMKKTGINGIYDKPKYLKYYHKGNGDYSGKYNEPRDIIVHGPVFSNDGKALIEARASDNKDRWIMLLDAESGNVDILDRQHDSAWIGGPGIPEWSSEKGNMGWIDNNAIWFQSEETGFSHLYTLSLSNRKKEALTAGDFEIYEAQISRDKKSLFITANPESPHERHFYHLNLNNKKLKKITSLPGNHEVTISPDEKHLAIRYSYSNKPWELYIMANHEGSTIKQITHSTSPQFEKYDWRVPDIIRFKASDGKDVPARIYLPGKNRNGAAIVFVHGAGYLQNVHNWWSEYYREYMFHNFLADNGYTVLDIDYRGSEGYGRDWRTAIYRHMGGRDLMDQVNGAEYLVNEHDIDPDRIGIYGGSYGGFITLMAMFTQPDVFRSGAALRSVADWAHYNHPYTSNILNTPSTDSIAYYRSSPVYHAEGLKGNLLMLHGMIDKNVHFQDVVRLSQRLIELGKDNWELAVFPLEDHTFIESSSWADEYKRIYRLFTETIKERPGRLK